MKSTKRFTSTKSLFDVLVFWGWIVAFFTVGVYAGLQIGNYFGFLECLK